MDRARADDLHAICIDLLSIAALQIFLFYYMKSDMACYKIEC